MQEFFRGRILAYDKMQIVRQKYVDVARPTSRMPLSRLRDRSHEFSEKPFRGNVQDPLCRIARQNAPSDRLHEMRHAQAGAAEQEQRVGAR